MGAERNVLKPSAAHAENGYYPPTLIRYLISNRRVFYPGLLSALFRSAVIAPIPWLFQVIIDDQVAVGHTPGIFYIAVIVVGMLLLHYAFAVSGAILISRQNGLMMMRLRGGIFNKLHFLHFGFLDRQKTGRLLSKYAFDTQRIEAVTMQIMNQFLPTILYSVAISIILITLHWQLSLLLVMMIPLYGVVRQVFFRRLKRVNEQTRLAQEQLTGAAGEAISALRLVRSFGEEEQVTQNLDEYSYSLTHSRFRLAHVTSIYTTFVYVMIQAFALITVAGGAYYVIQGTMTMGTLLAFMAGLPIVLMPVQAFAGMIEQYFVAQESYRSVKELLDSQYVEEWHGRRQLPDIKGDIRFDGVTFAYPETTRNVLEDFSLHIEGGKHTALVGPSGSGKSTIAQLILGLYKANRGAVTIDDMPQSELDMRWLRRQAAVVLQDIILFSGTVTENIRFARPDATEDEIREAARLANAEQFITQMPEGFDTIVGERGVMLSGGQRQRLSIARAILRNPRILILDEATSSLDYESERLVQEAVRRVAAGRTVLTIAHRLSTIKQADRIVVMKGGVIVEEGRYAELVARGGFFSELLNMQQTESDLAIETPER